MLAVVEEEVLVFLKVVEVLEVLVVLFLEDMVVVFSNPTLRRCYLVLAVAVVVLVAVV